ncbi:MAG TPA: hypothetical protein VK112_12640 [Fodinibius sp.]|nr:hypothetical protein [Fodinibius sp.]
MDKALPANILRQSVGTSALSFRGGILGDIVDIFYNNAKEQPEYIILKSSLLEGAADRYFAIPAFSTLVRITEKGAVVLKAEKRDLSLARLVRANRCPRANKAFDPSIHEIYQYDDRATKS